MQNTRVKAWFGSGSIVKILNGLNKQEFFSYHCRGRQMSLCGTLSQVSSGLEQTRPELAGTEKQSVAISGPHSSSFQRFLSLSCPSRSKDELRAYCIPRGRDISVPHLVIVVVTHPSSLMTTCSLSCARTNMEVTHMGAVP